MWANELTPLIMRSNFKQYDNRVVFIDPRPITARQHAKEGYVEKMSVVKYEMEVYKFKNRRAKRSFFKQEAVDYDNRMRDIIQPIQGIMPDSKEEYWVAVGLYRFILILSTNIQLPAEAFCAVVRLLTFLLIQCLCQPPYSIKGNTGTAGQKMLKANSRFRLSKNILAVKRKTP